MAVHALADGDMPCTQSLATRVVGVVVDLLLCTFWSVLRSSMNMVIILKRHVSASLGWVSGDGAGHLHVIATTVVNKASAKKKALSNFKSIDLAQFRPKRRRCPTSTASTSPSSLPMTRSTKASPKSAPPCSLASKMQNNVFAGVRTGPN